MAQFKTFFSLHDNVSGEYNTNKMGSRPSHMWKVRKSIKIYLFQKLFHIFLRWSVSCPSIYYVGRNDGVLEETLNY